MKRVHNCKDQTTKTKGLQRYAEKMMQNKQIQGDRLLFQNKTYKKNPEDQWLQNDITYHQHNFKRDIFGGRFKTI